MFQSCSFTRERKKTLLEHFHTNFSDFTTAGSSLSFGSRGNGEVAFDLSESYLDGGFKYFLFSTRSLGKWSNLTSIFFIGGWFNHQLITCGIFFHMARIHTFPKAWLCSRFASISQGLSVDMVYIYMDIPKIGVPQNGWFINGNTMKMDNLGVPLFLETPIYTIIYGVSVLPKGSMGRTVHLPTWKP